MGRAIVEGEKDLTFLLIVSPFLETLSFTQAAGPPPRHKDAVAVDCLGCAVSYRLL